MTRTLSLLAIVILGLLTAACVAAPVTPFYVAEYPATWTPGPTSTNTPKPPTATRVIQHTPGPLPTRDPNARRLPSAPRGGIGVWLDIRGMTSEGVALLAPRAQVFVEDGDPAPPRNPNNFYLTWMEEGPVPENFAARYDGAIVPGDGSIDYAEVRSQVAPRLMIVVKSVQNAAEDKQLLQTVDGICLCNFLKELETPSDAVRSETSWKRDVDALAELTSDADAVVLTATRFSEEKIVDFQDMQFWFDYALASFLLGVNNSHSFFGFQGRAGEQDFLGSPLVVSKLGTPLGAMSKVNAVYQRRFTNGLVIVNPSLEKRDFVLSKKYADATGRPVTTVHLEPAAGVILLDVE